MIVSFHTRDLRECCSSLERAERLLGAPDAQLLVGRLADIEALDNVGELIDFFGNDANLAGDDTFSVPIGPNYRATFLAVGAKLSRSVNGSPDWTKVQRLKLVDISRR